MILRMHLLTNWETRRINRSRATALAIVAIPVVWVVLQVFAQAEYKAGASHIHFFEIALVTAAVLICFRILRDKASGFLAGLESVPSHTKIVAASRIMTGIVIAAAQICIYAALKHFTG
jgi:hypothetical protein